MGEQSGRPKRQNLEMLTGLLKPKCPYTSNNLLFKEDQLDELVTSLTTYTLTDGVKLQGEKPIAPTSPREKAESFSSYRTKSTQYVFQNTGLKIPVSSSVSTNFYELLMEYLKI